MIITKINCHNCREKELQAQKEAQDLQTSDSKIAAKLQRLHLGSGAFATEHEEAAVHLAKASLQALIPSSTLFATTNTQSEIVFDGSNASLIPYQVLLLSREQHAFIARG